MNKIKQQLLKISSVFLLLIASNHNAMALTGVNPTGVNVRSHGVTTVDGNSQKEKYTKFCLIH